MSPSMSPKELRYDAGQKGGVAMIALAGLTSLLAMLYLLIIKRPNSKTFRGTHIFGYFICLLAANILQAIGAMVDFEWVARGEVVENASCSFQGAIKQAGNLGAASWSLIISIHVYLLIFFRIRSNKATFIATISFVWSLIFVLILVGRFALQESELGPYFGISGEECRIIAPYVGERIFFDYFFTLLSIGISLVLYTAVLLRIRGNLVKGSNKKWQLQFAGKENGWKVSVLSRDIGIANSTLRIAKLMLWYPVYYSTMLIPITFIRIYELHSNSVPFAITAISTVIFELMGLANVLFVIYIARCFPQTTILPLFAIKDQPTRNSDSFSKPGDIALPYPTQAADQSEDKSSMEDLPRIIIIGFPTEPSHTFVPPVSWKTSGGKRY